MRGRAEFDAFCDRRKLVRLVPEAIRGGSAKGDTNPGTLYPSGRRWIWAETGDRVGSGCLSLVSSLDATPTSLLELAASFIFIFENKNESIAPGKYYNKRDYLW